MSDPKASAPTLGSQTSVANVVIQDPNGHPQLIRVIQPLQAKNTTSLPVTTTIPSGAVKAIFRTPGSMEAQSSDQLS
ncbi:unnamed protein product [Darwinula stevensoni]|uniref:Uncharacterized protein n=1 Tax=Darwinula stevensoni TaxID=69355 RepID=A0A7R8X2K2_9CRUS|nr:unnamed protein product [Darwinula stevensoni]CAG0881306.1 unnamed protein product [Darwinula stevensoni]